MAITPHDLFDVWSPDEVAECMDGVSGDLYRRLWSLTGEVPSLTAEDETPDCQFKRALANIWHHLTAREQVELNALAARHIAQDQAVMDS